MDRQTKADRLRGMPSGERVEAVLGNVIMELERTDDKSNRSWLIVEGQTISSWLLAQHEYEQV